MIITTELELLNYISIVKNNIILVSLVILIECLAIFLIIVFFRPFISLTISKILGGKTITAVVDKAHNIYLRSGFTLKNGMLRKGADFYYKKYKGTSFFCGVPTEFVGLDSAYVQRPMCNVVVLSLITAGYKTGKSLKIALKKYNPDILKESFTEKEIENLLSEKNPSKLTHQSEIYSPLFSNLPLDVLSEYGADHMPTNINSYITDTMTFNQSPIEESFIDKYGSYIMLALLIMIGGAIAFAIVNSVK